MSRQGNIQYARKVKTGLPVKQPYLYQVLHRDSLISATSFRNTVDFAFFIIGGCIKNVFADQLWVFKSYLVIDKEVK